MHIRTIILMSGLLLSAASCVAMDTRGELREAITAHDLGRVRAAVTALMPVVGEHAFLPELLGAYGLALEVRDVGITQFLRDALYDERARIRENESSANGYRASLRTPSSFSFLGMLFNAPQPEDGILMNSLGMAIRGGDSAAVDFFIDLLFADYSRPAMNRLVEQAARSGYGLLILRLVARGFVDTAMLEVALTKLERELAWQRNVDGLSSDMSYCARGIAFLTDLIKGDARGDSSASSSGGPDDDAS